VLLSVVVPVYNEQEALPHFVQRVRPVLDGLGGDYEVVFVDDGSTDASLEALADLRRQWPQARMVELRRNAGHQAALTAGMEAARGRWIVTIDADLQDPPELIPDMIDAASRANADVVYAVRTDRASDSWFKRTTAQAFYHLMDRAVGSPVVKHAGDFRLLSASAVGEIMALPERGRVYRLLIPYMGFRSVVVQYSRATRVAGRSKYPIRSMVRLAADSYFSFTVAPLRFATWAGVVGFFLCVAFSVLAVVAYLTGRTVPGWASFALVIGFIGAVQFLFLGLIGEYLARVYLELQGRPRYFRQWDAAASAEAAAAAESVVDQAP
jgi:dolichol-phosphate mannosyltransferase